jgi:hypothetical protein
VTGVGHPGALGISGGVRFVRMLAVLESGSMGVVVRREGRIRQRYGAAISAALAGDSLQFIERKRSWTDFDVGYALHSADVRFHDIGICTQSRFDDFRALSAADSANGNDERSGLTG